MEDCPLSTAVITVTFMHYFLLYSVLSYFFDAKLSLNVSSLVSQGCRLVFLRAPNANWLPCLGTTISATPSTFEITAPANRYSGFFIIKNRSPGKRNP